MSALEQQLVKRVLPSVRDPYEGVRNEALRLLGTLQEGQPRVIIPLESVLEALWYLLETDRNKLKVGMALANGQLSPVSRWVLEAAGYGLSRSPWWRGMIRGAR